MSTPFTHIDAFGVPCKPPKNKEGIYNIEARTRGQILNDECAGMVHGIFIMGISALLAALKYTGII